MTSPSAVSLRRVSKQFGGVPAVDDLSLEIGQGQFVTLLGPSGCGKTTTLRMIGGFEHPDRGEIALGGVSMGNRPPYQRPTSLVFQQYALFPHLTVAGNIGFGLRERRIAPAEIRRRVEAMLELVELPGLGRSRPQVLSGGQQQRVALARSLVLEPTVLLLDEPLGALDLRLRRQMQIELKHIQRRVGITFLYVTHDQEEALTMSDRIVVMNRGRIEQDGTPEEVFERPRTRFVAEFTGARNVFDATVAAVGGERATVAFGGLQVDVRNDGWRSGDAVIVVLRPERVRLGCDDRAAAGSSRWPATVTEYIYKGAVMSYTVPLPDGTPLIVERARDRADGAIHAGETVGAAFDGDDLVVLAADS
ncbi:MAG: ABC transporter ATP-binding protein [Thermomicrobiales bacterium]